MTWRNIFWILFFVSIVLFLAPLRVTGGSTSGFDKIAHAAIFGLLLISSFQAYSRAKTLLLAALAVYAVGIELAQGTSFIGRDFEYWDILADFTGIVLGAIIARWK